MNRKGEQVSLPNEIINSINLACDFVLDGEIIGNTLHVFDILSININDLKYLSCSRRIEELNSFNFGSHIKIVQTARTTEEKKSMFERIKSEKGEGIVFKNKKSPYTVGRPASGGSQVKHKLYKTATFIVQDITKGKRSIGLSLIGENGEKIFVGRCTISSNFEMPEINDLVEVRYLYAFLGGAVYQPTFLGKRDDLDMKDAVITQLVYKQENETEV